MPDVADRTEYEGMLSDAFMTLFSRAYSEYANTGGIDWIEFGSQAGRVANAILAEVYLRGASQVAEDTGTEVPPETEREAEAWATQYAKELGRSVTDTTREMVMRGAARAKQAYDEDSDDDPQTMVMEQIAPAFSKARADMIAETEVTRALTMGQASQARHVQMTEGRPVNFIWRASRGACEKVCQPLDGKPYRVWSKEFPYGPPTHPHCRCWLEPEGARMESESPGQSETNRMERLWSDDDERKHPRGNAKNKGQFAKKGSAKRPAEGGATGYARPSAGFKERAKAAAQRGINKEADALREKIKGRMTEGLADFAEEHRARAMMYGRAIGTAMERMSHEALKSIASTLKGARFFPSPNELTEYAIEEEGAILKKGELIAGMYDHDERTLTLDGGSDLGVRADTTTAGVYAHELTHVIDHRWIHSNTTEWQKAFKAEIAGGKLNRYASTDPHEGFAEFGRLVYSSKPEERAIAQKQFPQAYAYFKRWRLIDGSAT